MFNFRSDLSGDWIRLERYNDLLQAAQKVEAAYLNNLNRPYPADLFIAIDELRDEITASRRESSSSQDVSS